MTSRVVTAPLRVSVVFVENLFAKKAVRGVEDGKTVLKADCFKNCAQAVVCSPRRTVISMLSYRDVFPVVSALTKRSKVSSAPRTIFWVAHSSTGAEVGFTRAPSVLVKVRSSKLSGFSK